MKPVPRMLSVHALKPHPLNARTHSKKQIRQIAASIQALGFTTPVLVDEQGVLLAGHGRLEAARLLGLSSVPAIVLDGLSEARKRLLLVADNKITENAGWDRQRLALELPELSELLIDEGLEIGLTGFEPIEIDQLQIDFEQESKDPADEIPDPWLAKNAVSRPGDLWLMDEHRLLCGDARDPLQLDRLMERNRAAVAFLDPPYNVEIKSIVGRGRIKHDEFVMASGEMTAAEFIAFLHTTLGNAARVSIEGAVHFVSMDWRHIGQLLAAGAEVYGGMLNLVVWVKSNAGQGSFYRSQHELMAVFRVGESPHLNNVVLGRFGRSRSNVWHYAGVNTFGVDRMAQLQSHPTAKPVALIADALRDCSRRGDIVLDTFCGSGSTILAAERVGRRAYGMELEPRYVDAAVRRWQAFTRRDALHTATGKTFEEVQIARAEDMPVPSCRVSRRRIQAKRSRS